MDCGAPIVSEVAFFFSLTCLVAFLLCLFYQRVKFSIPKFTGKGFFHPKKKLLLHQSKLSHYWVDQVKSLRIHQQHQSQLKV